MSIHRPHLPPMLARLAIVVAFVLSAMPAGAAEIFRQDNGWIVVKGPFENTDGQKFVDLANTVEGGTTVVFESQGGSASAAVTIGSLIRQRGWATIVEDGTTCASACAFAWVAGTPRLMDKDARIGFHAVYVIEDGKPVVSGPANAIIGSYLAELGLPAAAIYFTTFSKPDSMSWVTAGRAKNLGFDIYVLDEPKGEKKPRVKTIPVKGKHDAVLRKLFTGYE